MKKRNTARAVSVIIAIIMLAVTLYVPGIIAAENTGDNSVTLDYSTLADESGLSIDYYYSALGMLDGAGLNVKDGTVVTDADWHYQLNTVDTDVTDKNGGFAVYEIAEGTPFTAVFDSDTDLSSMKVFVSENGVDWTSAVPTADQSAMKLTLENKETAVSFVKLVWPNENIDKNGLISVTYTKAENDATVRRVDYGLNAPESNKDTGGGITDPNVYLTNGIWQSGGLWYLPNGTIVPNYNHLNSATTADSYNGYLTYKVQPGTRFSLTVTGNRSASDIAEKLGYENPLDWTVEVYGSQDNVNFTRIDASFTNSARYGNQQNGGDARRSTDINFIVPDGMVYIKCKLPITQNLSTLNGTDGNPVYPYIGNDIFEINKVEFTALKYDYYKAAEGDYYIDSALSPENIVKFGIGAHNNLAYKTASPIGIDIGYRVNSAYAAYDVVAGTPFYAGIRIEWTGGLKSYISQQGSYSVKLQGLNAGVWEDVDVLAFDETNNPYDGSTKFYILNMTATQNKYEQVRIYWGNKYGNDGAGQVTGNNLACISEVAFTAPKPDTRVSYEYNNLAQLPLDDAQNIGKQLNLTTSPAALGMYKISGSSGKSNLNRVNSGVLQPTWSGVYNYDAGTVEFYADYEVKGGTKFTATVTVNNDAGWGKPVWESMECYAGRKFEFKFLTSTDGITWTQVSSTEDKYGQLYVDVAIPENANFIRILFPQDGNPNGKNQAGKVFNDMASLDAVKFEPGNYNPYGENTYGEYIDYTDTAVFPENKSITAETNAEFSLYDAGISAMHFQNGKGIRAAWSYLDKAKDVPKPFVVYNVVSGTAFQTEISFVASSIKTIRDALGTDYMPKLYISSDNSVWTEYCDSVVEVTASKVTPDRSAYILTIDNIPDGIQFVKIELPQDNDASVATGGKFPYAGNDIIEIATVSLTKGDLPDPNSFTLDESKYGKIVDFAETDVATLVDESPYAMSWMKSYGLAGPSYSYFESSGENTRTKPNVVVRVKEGTPFFTEIQIRPNIYNSFIEGTYDSKIYFSKDAATWEDVTLQYRQRSGAGGVGFGLCERYDIAQLPEGVKYVKIEMPNERNYAGYVTNKGVRLSYIGNDYIGIRKIAYTPREENTYEHTVSYSDIYNKYSGYGIPSDIDDSVKNVLGLYDYSADALTMQSYQGFANGGLVTKYVMMIRQSYLVGQTELDRCYITYNVKPGTSFAAVMFADDDVLSYSAPQIRMKAYVSPTGEDGSWTEITDVWSYIRNNALSLDTEVRLSIDNVGENTNFVKIEFPQDGDYGLINPDATTAVGHNYYGIEVVKATLVEYNGTFEAAEKEEIIFNNPNQNVTVIVGGEEETEDNDETDDFYFDDDYSYDYDFEYTEDDEIEIEDDVSTEKAKKTKKMRVTKKILIPDGYTYALWFIILCIAGGVVLLAGITVLVIILVKKKKKKTAV